MTVNSPMDDVRAQYEALPYPPRDPRDEAIRLITGLAAEKPGRQVKLANRLFGHQGFTFLPEFTNRLASAFAAPLERVDYGYTPASNRQWRQELVASGQDEYYNYDGLYQVPTLDEVLRGSQELPRWMGWRLRLLVLAVLTGCAVVFMV